MQNIINFYNIHKSRFTWIIIEETLSPSIHFIYAGVALLHRNRAKKVFAGLCRAC